MLFRLLLWLALIGAVVWFWRKARRPAAPPPSAEPSSEPMVRCAHCGIHLPRRLAVEKHPDWYCSQAHLQQGPRPREH